MVKVDSPEFFEFMRRSAELRKAGKFKEAIEFVEGNLSYMAPECFVNAYMEAFKAAYESGEEDVARDYAERAYALDPKLPSIRRYLDR